MNQSLVDHVVNNHKNKFNQAPAMVVRAPGRVNLIGEHTDYNDGFVLPCAIPFATYLSISPNNTGTVNSVALDLNDSDHFLISKPITKSDKTWSNYIRGVVSEFIKRTQLDSGFDIVFSGDVPQGAGLSSSASLEIALAKAVNELFQLRKTNTELAEIGQSAEHHYAGCQCGLMDQLASVECKTDSALLIDCANYSNRSVMLPQGYSVLIINSNVKRGLVDSEYNSRREQCQSAASKLSLPSLRSATLESLNHCKVQLSEIEYKRALHVISENQRVLDFTNAIENQDLSQAFDLMRESHNSLRDNYQVTVTQTDWLVERLNESLQDQGAARMTGGGFGGCVVALVPNDKVEWLALEVKKYYKQAFDLVADTFVVEPSQGAEVITE